MQKGPLAQQDDAEGGHAVLQGLHAVDHILHHGYLARGEVFLMSMDRFATKGEDALGDLIDLELEVRVELFELGVQLEEFLAADVPMEATCVHVEHREVGEQVVEACGKLASSLGIESDGGQ